MSDILISPIQRMARYKLLVGVITSALDPNDIEVEYLKQMEDKVSNINDMQYGDSSLLNLYHLIREAPASLIQTRQLLGYFDATELSLLSGKSNRPVTILVFTDKLMVVKRKNYNLQGKDVLHKIEEKVKNTTTTSMLQKAKEAYTGLPLEFKGWVDIKAVEMFHGLKDRPDTFFLRTTLPELDPNATEKETEDYFRRSDRLYSIIPNTTTTKHQSLACFIEKKNEFIALCQKQFAVAKLKDTTNELYYEDKFKLPAYTHFYDEESYHQMEHKNHILVVYVDSSSTMIDLNKLITDDVWIVILLTRHKSGGYKPTIRARTSLIPIREINRDMEYEHIVNDQCQKDSNMPLDFIDTLWNNLFFYERRLRATEAFSCVNDDLLRARARSRSRSKSLTRVASNMSIGKLFARSRSSSPSRHSALDQQEDDVLDQATHVPDPVFKVATINKQLEEEFRSQNMADMRGPKSSRISTQPHTRGGSLPSEIFVRDDIQFIDAFNEKKTTPEEMLYSGSNIYQDNSFNRPNPYPSTSTSTSSSGRRRGSIHGLFTDVHHFPHYYRHSSSPESISRPSSGGSCSSSSETTPSSDPVHFIRPMNDAMGSYSSSSSRSYFDDHVKTMDFFLPSPHREKYYGSPKSNSPSSCDERLMCTIDGSRRSNYNRRAPLPPNFYNQPQAPMQPTPSRQPGLAHRPHTVPAVNDFVQLKHDVNGMIDELIQSHQQMRLQDPHQYYNSTYETVKGVRSHIVSKLDEIMDDLNHTEQYQYELR
ncbi:hypothetical protein CU098_012109 [Rhizopus stolonifer]|uniref:DH domain-containing protein n=1 Tax=Rhizopus stolonifer TaxID=4846 RepID=A0A367KPW2_RHIST|nr:hypothetical protein CU098_012109 [Rhizopus stolonifer]